MCLLHVNHKNHIPRGDVSRCSEDHDVGRSQTKMDDDMLAAAMDAEETGQNDTGMRPIC